jgi:hypothetical protein
VKFFNNFYPSCTKIISGKVESHKWEGKDKFIDFEVAQHLVAASFILINIIYGFPLIALNFMNSA